MLGAVDDALAEIDLAPIGPIEGLLPGSAVGVFPVCAVGLESEDSVGHLGIGPAERAECFVALFVGRIPALVVPVLNRALVVIPEIAPHLANVVVGQFDVILAGRIVRSVSYVLFRCR